jgi:iron complex transport system substrate-binding protein
MAGVATAEVRVQDDSGRTLVLAQPARRIVSLAPHITELLYAAGAGAALVGAVDYSDYPRPALALPRIGGHDRLDLERILALQPDLAVAWQSGTAGVTVQRLQALGIPVFYSEPRTLEDIPRDLLRLGQLAGTEAVARQAATDFQQGLQNLRARYAGARPVRVFYQIWQRPLMTVNGAHLISDVIRLCGGENIFAGLSSLAPQVGMEAVLAADPEVIIAGGLAQEQPHWREAWRVWPRLAAVRGDHLYYIPPDLMQRHTPRILQGAEQLCARLEQVRTRRRGGAE